MRRRAYTNVNSTGYSVAALRSGGTSFGAYVARRVAAVCVVVLVTPSLTYVLFGSLRAGASVTDQASQLPGYLSDTFLHLDFGYGPKFHQPRQQGLRISTRCPSTSPCSSAHSSAAWPSVSRPASSAGRGVAAPPTGRWPWAARSG